MPNIGFQDDNRFGEIVLFIVPARHIGTALRLGCYTTPQTPKSLTNILVQRGDLVRVSIQLDDAD
jgi:hypothetical protein